MRLFIAIELPMAVKEGLVNLQAYLQKEKVKARWTGLANLHLTLQFLGDVPSRMVGSINDILGTTAASFSPFSLQLSKIGCFPHEHNPRIIWAGLTGEVNKLIQLQEGLSSRLASIGFNEDKPFKPHITLGRDASYDGVFSEICNKAGNTRGPSFYIEGITLMESRLQRPGSTYLPLYQAFLKQGR